MKRGQGGGGVKKGVDLLHVVVVGSMEVYVAEMRVFFWLRKFPNTKVRLKKTKNTIQLQSIKFLSTDADTKEFEMILT